MLNFVFKTRLLINNQKKNLNTATNIFFIKKNEPNNYEKIFQPHNPKQ